MSFGDVVQADATQVDVLDEITINLPNPPTPGNLLFVMHGGPYEFTPTPAWSLNGWEQESRDQTNQVRATTWWKKVTAGDPQAFSVNISSNRDQVLAVVEFEGPIRAPVTPGGEDHTAGSQGDTTLVTEPLDTIGPALLVLGAVFNQPENDIVGYSSGFTEIIQSATNPNIYFGIVVAYLLSTQQLTGFSPTLTSASFTSESTWLGAFYEDAPVGDHIEVRVGTFQTGVLSD